MRMEIDYEEEKQRKNNILSIAVGDFCPDAVSFFWMVRSAFMTNREIMTVPIQWLPSHYDLSNFRDAFRRAPFSRYFVNSAVIVLINMTGSVLSSSFIAFGFSRMRFMGKNLWFALLLSTMMIPQTVLMIPQFLIWQAVGLTILLYL